MNEKIQKNISRQTISGLIWSAFSAFSSQGFQFVVTIILARLLLPGDFGTVGMATIFIALISIINEMGFSAAIIQKKDLKDNHLNTSFWTGIITGVLFFIISIFASSLVADFFKNDLVKPIIILSSVSFFIAPFGIVQRSLLTKKLEFRKLATVEVCTTFISGIFAITLAMLGFGVWSLVFMGIARNFITVVLLWKIEPWHPSLYFNKKCFSDLFRFGGNVVGSNLLNYLRQNVDYIVIGYLMGATSLGYYTLAYTLAVYPARTISPIITRVTFPVFSMLQDDNNLLKRNYLKVVFYLSAITIPALVGLEFVAPEFIKIVYGEKWIPAIIPLQFLIVIGIVNSISTTVGTIFYAKGRPDLEFKLNLIKLPITTLMVLLGSGYGINGVASYKTITAGAYFFITQMLANSLIKLTMREYFSVLKPVLFNTFVMAIILGIYRFVIIIFDYQNDLNVLVSSIIIGVIVYLILMRNSQPELFNDITGFVKNKLGHYVGGL